MKFNFHTAIKPTNILPAVVRKAVAFLKEQKDGDLFSTSELITSLGYANFEHARKQFKHPVLAEYRSCRVAGKTIWYGNKKTIIELAKFQNDETTRHSQ